MPNRGHILTGEAQRPRDAPGWLKAEPLLDSVEDVARLARKLAKREHASARAVHRLRGAARRAEARLAALGVAWPSLEPAADRVRRPIVRLRRLAGRVRDADVMVALVKSGVLGSPPGDPKHKRLRRAIAQRRREDEAELLDRAKRLVRRVESRAAELEELAQASAEADAWPAMLAAIRRVESRLGQELADPDALHGLRLSLKRLRYTAEAIGNSLPLRGSPLASLLERMGSVSDLSMASRFVRGLAARASKARGRELESLANAADAMARDASARLSPQALRKCQALLRAIKRGR